MTCAYSALKLAAHLPSLHRITAGAHYEKRIFCTKYVYCFCFRFLFFFFFVIGKKFNQLFYSSHTKETMNFFFTKTDSMPAEVKKLKGLRILVTMSRMNFRIYQTLKECGSCTSFFSEDWGTNPHILSQPPTQKNNRHSFLQSCLKLKVFSCFQCMMSCPLDFIFPVEVKE